MPTRQKASAAKEEQPRQRRVHWTERRMEKEAQAEALTASMQQDNKEIMEVLYAAMERQGSKALINDLQDAFDGLLSGADRRMVEEALSALSRITRPPELMVPAEVVGPTS